MQVIFLSECFYKFFKIFLEALADFGVVKCNLAVSLHNAELVAHVISLAVKVICKKLIVHAELGENVGEIELLVLGSCGKTFFNKLKGFGRQNNSAENGEKRKNLVVCGLFDNAAAGHCSVLALDG